MTPFLKQIAEAYATECADELIDCCFVFPNKRCSVFFSNYIRQASKKPIIEPATTDIDTLITDLTRAVMMPRIEQLFVLFDCYRRIVRKNTGTEPDLFFDSFLGWGETVLNDFNDVDRYLVDPAQIFKNIKFFKEISSNFLTEEQVAIINHYWRDPITFAADARMWKHLDTDTPDQRTVKSFFSLWTVLFELYESFGHEVSRRGFSYPGMSYRRCAELLSGNEIRPEELPFKRYVFVGFNALSASEEKIFDYFKDKKIGAFYWDSAGPLFKDKHNPAMSFVGRYVKRYPQDESLRYDFDSHIPDKIPEIHIIGIPSNFGQVKEAARLLDNLKKEHPEEFINDRARQTAVVLPDESLCIPLVNSLPKEVRPINITMGYPLKNTSVMSLINNILKMQDKVRINGVTGSPMFYYDDVKTLLAHPLLRSTYSEECERTVRQINTDRIFNLPLDAIERDCPGLAPFFMVFDHKSSAKSLEAVDSLLKILKKITESNGLDHAFVLGYIMALETVKEMTARYDVMLAHTTVFGLLQRLAGGETVHFAGEPLEGIQIMGMLETRALDFENLMILSMNEHVFPRKIQTRSFIPMELRAGYGLATTDHQESIFAYYFYRLISRARRVYLLYDARNYEMSRYLYQLIYLIRDPRTDHRIMSYSLRAISEHDIEIKKTPAIMDAVNRFRTPGSDAWLSPHSINRFLECGLAFFLENIANYRSDNDMKDYMDESEYGTVFHNVAQLLYKAESSKNGNSIFTPAELRKIAETRRELIEHLTVAAIKETHYKVAKELIPASGLKVTDLPGDTELIAELICDSVTEMLRREAENQTVSRYVYIKGEEPVKTYVEFTPRLGFNLKGYIDRIDRVTINGTEMLRFVDYKTGSDPISTFSLDNMFDPKCDQRPKAMLQLMLYCNAYAAQHHESGPIIPQIYRIRDFAQGQISFLKIGKDEVLDYRPFNEQFLEKLETLMLPLFDPEVPFTRSESGKPCKYCGFAQLCGRNTR